MERDLIYLLVMDLEDKIIVHEDILAGHKEGGNVSAPVAGYAELDPVVIFDLIKIRLYDHALSLIRDRDINVNALRHVGRIGSALLRELVIVDVEDQRSL